MLLILFAQVSQTLCCEPGFPHGSVVKNLPAMQKTQEMWVLSLGPPYSSILAWKVPCTEELGRLLSRGLQRIEYSWTVMCYKLQNTNYEVSDSTYEIKALTFAFKIGLAPHTEGYNSCSWFLVLFSHSVVSNSSWPHGLQHARLPCSSPSPGACSNSCHSSQWCHPTISSSVAPFSCCLQSFPASGSFLMSQLFTSGDQSIGVSTSVLPKNIQAWFPLGWTGLISLQSKGLSKVFSNTTVQKHQFLVMVYIFIYV